jgi:hypothetical protein
LILFGFSGSYRVGNTLTDWRLRLLGVALVGRVDWILGGFRLKRATFHLPTVNPDKGITVDPVR